jgi:autotransporter-associated beta strand protein
MRVHISATLAAAAIIFGTAARAQDATWLTAPGSGNFNTATNWSSGAVPTGTAFFGTSNTTSLTLSANTSVGGWTFNAGASTYTFNPGLFVLSFTGAGIVINGGSATIINTRIINFFNASSAGSATIVNNALINFENASTAGSATIINNSAVFFDNTSTAGSATLITNNGGLTFFEGSSTAGLARVVTNGGGTVDISGLTSGGLTAGSIEGAGSYLLGSKTLTVGGNNLSTDVSGTIRDGGAFGGTGGSLVKVGTGTLTLSGANTYTGQTTVTSGAINLTGSLLSPVAVEPGGTLGGTGTVFNTVTNAGIVEPGLELPTGTFGNLTVNNYVGAGGILALRTFLGGDGSPSDLLTINGGTATGSTSVRITNVGGPGAETTGNGILVVNAINGATTAPGAFTLANPELRAGAFDYRLFQGGFNGSDPNDFFLRSSFIEQGPPAALVPIIGPELATDGVVQPIARQMGLQTLGTLHQRTGDTLTLANAGGEVLVTKDGVTLANASMA